MSTPSISTFNEDCLNLRPFAERLERYISVERHFVEGGLVISLGAPFGAGKTTFLRMWRTDLEERRKSEPTLPCPIVLNAWESDFCGDPLIALVTGLIEAVEYNHSPKAAEEGAKLREAAKDVVWFAAGVANSVVANLTGVDALAAGELATAKKEARKPQIPDIIRLYQNRIEALKALKELLQKQFGENAGGAIIMVDELDRCRPDYAISYLETIKHVFNLPSLCFILAVDYKRIAGSATKVFGDLNFEEYYRKFVHRAMYLPVPNPDGLTKLARVYTAEFLEKENVRISLLKIDDHTVESVVELIGAFQLTLRQTQESFRIMGHVLSGDSKSRGRIYWGLGVGTILMAVLRVANRNVYEAIGKGRQSHEDFGKLLVDHIGKTKAEWWFGLYITGTAPSEGEEKTDIEALYRKLNFIRPGDGFDRRERLGQVAQGWGHSATGRLQQIYSKIEEAASL